MSLTDYSDLEKEVNNAPSPHQLPKGTEAKLRIIAVRTGESQKPDKLGAKWFSPLFDCPDDPLVVPFNDFFWDLSSKDKIPADMYAKNLYRFQTFKDAFKIDLSKPFDMEVDWIGKTGYATVGIQTDAQYGDKNSISKYTAGPARSKASTGTIDDNDIPY